ncbi:MAG: 1-acyl-sn-glycerol-3-phosphate acyltransferase [Candidatus Eremiobacteraeota bacterium]|nr:1-acyl-sn-glycerol-3-phosphate acyltransferase [Candidatus Eremiobacteraeota bacterium]MCW5869759.1 1-acyl-sn-glycerol-3-phosphate acyltransferase [Candidatus Eremiobacteraeota bacterium]
MAGDASAFYRVAQGVLRFSFRVLQGLQVDGLENVPAQGACLIVSNHCSWLDPPVLGCSLAHRQLHFMAKKELFERPLLGRVIRALGAFPVERGQADRKSLRLALDLLGQGRIVCLFPEGTRGRGGPMGPWHVGVAMLANHAGVPIVPAALTGTRNLLEERAQKPARSPIRVRFGPALHFHALTGTSRERLHKVQAGVQQMLDGMQ